MPRVQDAADHGDEGGGEEQVEAAGLAAGHDDAAGHEEQHDHDVGGAAVEDGD